MSFSNRKAATMDAHALRTLIRAKLTDGRLPIDHMPRIWGGPGEGEVCDGCDLIVPSGEFVMEGVSLDDPKRAVQFHVMCFHIWDDERRMTGA